MSQSKKISKYKIKCTLPSIVGFATKSVKAGETGSISTQMQLYNHENISDDDISLAHSQIYSTLAQHIFPMMIKSFSGKKIPKDFALYAVYVEFHSDESKNRILINEDTNFRILCKLKKGINLKKNDPIYNNQVEYITSIEKVDQQPNTATILLTHINGNWFGKFDYIYNRENVLEKMERAIDFFNSALENLKNTNMTGFYQSLWDCAELLAESLLLLHNQIKLKAEHKKIKKLFQNFCQLYQISYYENYEKITQIRNNSRYGPPHPKVNNSYENAQKLLHSTHGFLKFVLDFTKERQVVLNSEELNRKIDISAIKPKKS